MKYSIITPVFNREDCVARCLDSVVENLKWGIEIEHIVVDDGSHDSTANIVQKYAMQYPHIHFIKFDKNRGTNAARNAAIAEATGDFCVILDSDDYFVDDAIKSINDVVISNSYLHYFFMPDDMVQVHQQWELLKEKKFVVITYEDLLLGRVDGDFVHVINTAIIKKYPFDENLRINEAVFFQRMHKEEREVLFVNQITTIRERDRKDSVSLTCSRKDKKAIERSIKAAWYWVEWFGQDMIQCEDGKNSLRMYLNRIYDYSIILSDYANARVAYNKMIAFGIGTPNAFLQVLYKLKLGWLYRILGNIYVTLRR